MDSTNSTDRTMRAVVFAGAGASFGTSKHKYPTTAEFYRSALPPEIVNDQLFGVLSRYVRETKLASPDGHLGSGEPPVDIEELLFAANEFEQAIASFVLNSPSAARYVAATSAPAWASMNPQAFFSFAETMLPMVRSLRQSISAAIHRAYEKVPTTQELEKTWTPFLSSLIESHTKIDVFTTNYDLVLETAIQHAKLPIDVGQSDVGYRTLNEAMWSRPNYTGEGAKTVGGLLTKLHGSLNWTWGSDGQINVGGPDYFHVDKQVAIYPGFKGEPSRAPFIEFHNYLEHCLAQADIVIFVGFAFRDQYLNGIFRRYLASAPTVVVIVDPNANAITVPFPDADIRRLNYPFSEAVQKVKDLVGFESFTRTLG